MSSSSTATRKFGGPLIVGLELDVKDTPSSKWYQAEIIESQFFKIQIRYKNYNSQYNTEWISTEKELHRLEPLGTHTVVKIEQTVDKVISNNNDSNDNNNNLNIDNVINESTTTSTSTPSVISSSDEKEDAPVMADYYEENDSGFVVTNVDKSDITMVSNEKNNNNKNTSNNNFINNNNNNNALKDSLKVISSLETKVTNLETKLQTALRNDVVLNDKVNNLTKENEALRAKAARMTKEINSLKQMINELKNEEFGVWEEVE